MHFFYRYSFVFYGRIGSNPLRILLDEYLLLSLYFVGLTSSTKYFFSDLALLNVDKGPSEYSFSVY